MTWKWDKMTVNDFKKAVKDTKGVCLIPVGVLEKHGGHLPLGTDCSSAMAIAERAVQREPAILFPVFPFGQIHEAKHWPGAIAIRTSLILELLENLCDEIARNGIKKIVLLNAHGGNEHMLSHFTMSMLEKKRNYTLYVARVKDYFPGKEELKKAGMESEFDGHAGEIETSILLAIHPKQVKMEQIETDSGQCLGRLKHLPAGFTSMFWYADFPNHYAGDARPASAEKGEKVIHACSEAVSRLLKAIKEDSETPRLQNEFFSDIRH